MKDYLEVLESRYKEIWELAGKLATEGYGDHQSNVMKELVQLDISTMIAYADSSADIAAIRKSLETIEISLIALQSP